MPLSIFGAPSAAAIIGYMDPLATWFKALYPTLGLNAPGETLTAAALAGTAEVKILGDGAGNPGLGNPVMESLASDALKAFVLDQRYDIRAKRTAGALMRLLDNVVLDNLPAGWNFLPTGMQHAFDAHLLRMNGAHTGVPTTPAAAGVLTAITDANGTLPNVAAGSARRVVHTLIGTNDYDESLPSAEATQVALTGSQNGYGYQIAGAVPAGVNQVGIYGGVQGGAGGTYYYLKRYPVTPSAGAYPVIPILEADTSLRDDWIPPSWLSCLMVPEAAALFGAVFGTLPSGNQAENMPLIMAALGMLSPSNVVLGPINGFLGVGNQAAPQTGRFGITTITGAATQTWAPGTVATLNNPGGGVQGFAGATKLRARVTAVTNGATDLTITYTYYNAANGWGNIQTSGAVTTTVAGTALDSVGSFAITAGRIVVGVTVTAKGNASTSGQLTIEAEPARTY